MKKVYAFMAAFLAVTSFSFAQEDTTAVNDDMRIYDVVETLAEFPGGRKECMKSVLSRRLDVMAFGDASETDAESVSRHFFV